ncbi:MAG: hypothetical protein M3Q31_24515 [Actinomycetota bacterium]|nr:hypothetical protein [Actinomycetota bacterium]
MRRPAPATVIATIALVLAAAPIGQAANGWVKRALYARNAGSVDGISASRTPHKGKLIALPASGKLPASIFPASMRGPRGPAGPAGSDGTDGAGASALVATAGSAVSVGTAQTGVVTLQLKAGSYALVAKASLHATLDTSTPGVTCLLKAGSDGDQADADLSSSSDDPVALIATHTFATPGAATLTCAADDSGVVASDARIIALRVTALTSP